MPTKQKQHPSDTLLSKEIAFLAKLFDLPLVKLSTVLYDISYLFRVIRIKLCNID